MKINLQKIKALGFVVLIFLCFVGLPGCKKQSLSANQIDIYELKSFTLKYDTTQAGLQRIENPVLKDSPVLKNSEIQSYSLTQHTFKITVNANERFKNLNGSNGFAITVNNVPVYFGLFHPAYLSSMVLGVPTIDPIMTTESAFQIDFVNMHYLQGDISALDKRNDDKIIKALKDSGRLRP